MRCKKEIIGSGVCAFGAGVLLSAFLPGFVMVCIQGGVIIAAGVLLLY